MSRHGAKYAFATRVALVSVAVLLRWASATDAAIPPRTVVVNGSSLANPIGVGFGHWEGAQVLTTSLSATPPSTIKTASPTAGEAVIWQKKNPGFSKPPPFGRTKPSR
jgi:hypothetical protein